jgi:hypothetical protein
MWCIEVVAIFAGVAGWEGTIERAKGIASARDSLKCFRLRDADLPTTTYPTCTLCASLDAYICSL